MNESTGKPIVFDAHWFRTLAESAWYAVFAYRKGRLIYANPASAELTGYDLDELLSLDIAELIDSRFYARFPDPDAESGVYPRFETPIEVPIRRKDGASRWIALTNAVFGVGGQTTGIGSAVDITPRKSAASALSRRLDFEKALTQISRSLFAHSSRDIEDGIGEALEHLIRAISADCTFVALLGDDQETVTTEIRFNEGRCSMERPAGHTLRKYGIERDELLASEVLTLSGDRGRQVASGCGCDAGCSPLEGILIPLVVEDRILGFQFYGWNTERPAIDADDLRVFRVSAEIMSGAIALLSAEDELRHNRNRFELAQRAGRSVAWEWNRVTDRMYMFDSAAEIFGFAPDCIPRTGAELQARIPPEQRRRVAEAIRSALRTGKPYSVEHQFLLPDDETTVWISARGRPIIGKDGRVEKLMGVSADITERRSAEVALSEERERATVTLSSIDDGVVRTSLSGTIEYMNPAAERLLGWRLEDALGRPLSEVYRVVEDGPARRRRDLVAECIDKNASVSSTDWRCLFHRSGREFAVRESASPIREESGAATGVVLVIRDVTQLRGLERKMAYQASHDTLTGLLNRQEFEQRVKEALTNAGFTARVHALCYLDLDAFKVINDTCGHSVGDILLQQLAGTLEATARGTDILARLGGDEFGLLLTDCSLDEALERAEAFLDAVRAFRFIWKSKIFEVGVSIGIVPLDRDSPTYTELLAAADAACFVAKENGRNRIHISRPDDHQIAARFHETQWVQRLNRAINDDDFVLWGQVIEPLQDGSRPVMTEILLRLEEGEELVPPGRFIPAAERFRMMPMLDAWVIDHAFKEIRDFSTAVPGDRRIFALNLSGQSLADTAILTRIFEGIDDTGIDPARLCFEITETAAISNLVAAQAFIRVLQDRGCAFALDDFGAGLSSFRYLKDLPVDYLKIDGGLVRDVASDRIHHEMVDAIRRMAAVMGLETIGEWVESTEARYALKEIGIDFVQGYAVGRPAPLDTLL